MADISELLIEVKNVNNTLSDIDKVGKKLKETQQEAIKLGKGLFAGWTFTKLVKASLTFSDAWKENLVTLRSFDEAFGKFNEGAIKGITILQKKFHDTEIQAKKMFSTIRNRINSDFNFSQKKATEVTSNLSVVSKEIASFYGMDVSTVSQKLALALNGSTKSLREFGIVIDTNSPKMKKMIEELKIANGETEESAKALAVYNEILRQSGKYEGSFEAQSKTLSQAVSDIMATLKSGIFAQAGQILSTIFVPVLEKINAILANNWVQRLGGIATVLGTILAATKSITVTMNLLRNTLGGLNLAGLLGGSGSSLLAGAGAGLGVSITRGIQGWWNHFTDTFIGSGAEFFNAFGPSLKGWWSGVRATWEVELFKWMEGTYLSVWRGLRWISDLHDAWKMKFVSRFSEIFGHIMAFSETSEKAIRALFLKTRVGLLAGIAGLVAILVPYFIARSKEAIHDAEDEIEDVAESLGSKLGSIGEWLWDAVTFQWVPALWNGALRLGQRLTNLLIFGLGFKTDEQILDEKAKSFKKRVKKIEDTIDKFKELTDIWKDFQQDEFFEAATPQKILDYTKKEIDILQKQYKSLRRSVSAEEKEFQNNLTILKEWASRSKEFQAEYERIISLPWKEMEVELKKLNAQYRILSEKGVEDYVKMAEKREKDLTRLKNLKQKLDNLQEKANKAREDINNAAEEAARQAAEFSNEVVNAYYVKFADFSWYVDAMQEIKEGLGNLTSQDKINAINEKIKKFKELMSKTDEEMTDEQRREANKKLASFELEKFKLEMDIINKERKVLEDTNKMVEDYVKRAMEWKPSGVQAIQANTMEGYKFMTSSFGSLTSLGSVLNSTQSEQSNLQRRANTIATSTQNIVKSINDEVRKLTSSQDNVVIQVVDFNY